MKQQNLADLFPVLPRHGARKHRREGAVDDEQHETAESRPHALVASDSDCDNDVSVATHGRLGYHEVERRVCFLKPLAESAGGESAACANESLRLSRMRSAMTRSACGVRWQKSV